jgi:hypothetical protein
MAGTGQRSRRWSYSPADTACWMHRLIENGRSRPVAAAGGYIVTVHLDIDVTRKLPWSGRAVLAASRAGNTRSDPAGGEEPKCPSREVGASAR